MRFVWTRARIARLGGSRLAASPQLGLLAAHDPIFPRFLLHFFLFHLGPILPLGPRRSRVRCCGCAIRPSVRPSVRQSVRAKGVLVWRAIALLLHHHTPSTGPSRHPCSSSSLFLDLVGSRLEVDAPLQPVLPPLPPALQSLILTPRISSSSPSSPHPHHPPFWRHPSKQSFAPPPHQTSSSAHHIRSTLPTAFLASYIIHVGRLQSLSFLHSYTQEEDHRIFSTIRAPHPSA